MLTFNAERHEYKLDGTKVPSVTQITAPLMDFTGIPQGVLERKRQIGTALHKAIELHLADDLVFESIALPVVPYFEAYLKFVNDTGFITRNSEMKVASEKYGYAGTLDLDGVLNKRLSQIDFKTTATLSPAVAIQTAGYEQAANEMPDVDSLGKVLDRYALWFKPDGSYKLVQYKDKMDFQIFLSLLNVFKFKQKHNL
jgi:hypothetical protein